MRCAFGRRRGSRRRHRLGSVACLMLFLTSAQLQTGCAGFVINEPRLDFSGGGMTTDLAEPLIYARQRTGAAPMPAQFILIIPSSTDSATAGGATLSLACGANIDSRHWTQDPCAPLALELRFGRERQRFSELVWQPPEPQRKWVKGIALRAVTTVPITTEVLGRLASAADLSVVWIGALDSAELLSHWHGTRATWNQRDAADGLRFRARVFPDQKRRQ